jgi:hypothetical protein
MNGCQTKVLFGLEDHDDALYMAKRMNPDVNLQEWKDKLTRPTVTGIRIEWLESESEAGTESSSETELEDGTVIPTAGKGQARGQSRHQAAIPEYEDLPVAPYSMEEQFHRIAVKIMAQSARHAIIRLPAQNTAQQFVTHRVTEAPASKRRVEEAKQAYYLAQGFATPRVEVREEIARRLEALKEKALDHKTIDLEPRSFRE